MEKERALPDMRGPLFSPEGATEVLKRYAQHPPVPLIIFNLVFAMSVKKLLSMACASFMGGAEYGTNVPMPPAQPVATFP
jgi:hypothetical protein